MVEEAGDYTRVGVRRDLSGHDRIVVAHRRARRA